MAIPEDPVHGTSTNLVAPQLPLWTRLFLTVKLRLMKILFTAFLKTGEIPGLRKRSQEPTFKKIYPVQKTLTNRIYVPKSYKSDDAALPLHLHLHGSGFALGSPMLDDRFCSEFAHSNKFLVVNLDYPKAPDYPFPGAVNALVDVINAVLEDESLPFDRKKVSIGGFSAGGNLALAVVQDESLQAKIGGVVSIYGVLDFTIPTKAKIASRPEDAPPDLLENMSTMLNWGYLDPGTDLRDPQLSVALAPQEKLPPKIYIIGCEYDMLCRESEIMAQRLATERSGETVDPGDVWEKAGIKWENILREEHGFDQIPAFGENKIRAEKRRTEMFDSVARWLSNEVYA